MNRVSLAVVLSGLMWAASFSAFSADGLVDKYSDDNLIQILRQDGYGAVGKIKDGAIRFKVEGSTYVLYNQQDGDLQLYYSLSGAKISFDVINEWNKTKRLSRAYLDSDLDPTLESDLLANAGMTEKHVTEFLRLFKISVSGFREFIIKNMQK